MKRILIHILIIAVMAPTILGFATPRVANAACLISAGSVISGNSFNILDCVNELATFAVLPIAGKFLQLGGYLFGAAVKANLYISDLVDNRDPTKPSVIQLIWKNIRDLSSIIFIGVLLYASFMMILGAAGQGIGKLIVSIVLAGLLMNFSLFATRLVIDASNTISLAFYNAITPGVTQTSTPGGGGVTASWTEGINIDDGGISANVMGALQIQTILASSKNNTGAQWALKSVITIVGGVVLMIIAGIAFFAGALMFIYRLVTLVILMAFSPLPVIAMILPQTAKYSEEWMSKLLNQCFFAPIYLLLMYVALRVATDPQLTEFVAQGSTKGGLGDVFNGLTIGPLLQYGIVIALMYYALVAANSFGAKGAKLGMDWMDGVKSWGQGFVGRNTAGRAARLAGQKYDNFLSNPEGGRITGALKRIGAVTGVDRGIRETLTKVEKAKYGNTTLEGEEKADKAREKDLKNLTTKTKRQNTIDANVKVLEDNSASQADKGRAHNALKDALKNLSAEELKGLDKDALGKVVASRLSASQFETVMKNEGMTEEDKATVKKNRADGISDIINNPLKYTEAKGEGGTIKLEEKTAMGAEEVLKGNLNEIAKLNGDNLADLALFFTKEQYKKIMNMNDVSSENKKKITDKRADEIKKIATTPKAGEEEKYKKFVKSMDGLEFIEAIGKDVGKLKTLAPYLQASHLKQISADNTDVGKEVAKAVIDVGVTAPAYSQAIKIARDYLPPTPRPEFQNARRVFGLDPLTGI